MYSLRFQVPAASLFGLLYLAGAPAMAACPVIATFHCDETLSGSLSGAANQVSEYSCMPFQPFPGPEVAFQFVAYQDDTLTVEFWGKAVGDLFVLEDSCDGTACLQGGGILVQSVKAGHTYYFVVEGWDGLPPGLPFEIKLSCMSTCPPQCDGKECGEDGCGGTCGECAAGVCWNGLCLEGDGCMETPTPTCSGCVCEACVCGIDPYCCNNSWDSLCVQECAFQCSGCGLLQNCGDGACQPLEYENCDTCGEDCICQAGETCFIGSCCHPNCSGKSCGDDGCGGVCGDCGDGYCSKDGKCMMGPGCEYSNTPGCGGCLCEACVCAMDPFCCGTAWDGLCIDECINWCEGCASLENCGDGVCQTEEYESCGTCVADCPCQAGEKCFKGNCCHPSCAGKECGDDGCGGTCGECPWGEACVDFACGPNDGCTAWEQAGCGGCLCEACVCDIYPWCCQEWWFPECVDLCQWECGGCALLENCGDGQCDGGGGENCANCPGDCTCNGDAVCFQYKCCVPSCEGKECGDDGCGGWCGDCDWGLGCSSGQCIPNDGCMTWNSPGCGGCMCESCVCTMDPFCCDVAWDGLCVDECQFDCGGCVSMLNCGDGQCQAGEGETCSSCKADCACVPGESCFAGKCCKADCSGKQCGSDGCGGSCGKCPCPGCPPENTACGLDGQCVLDTASPCKKVMLCLMACEDDWCMQGCLDQSGPDAIDKYQVWLNCMMANGIEQCWDSVCAFTVWQSCLSEFNDCTQGTMACPLVAECLFACGNDGNCGNACLVEGSPEANDVLWKFLICAFDGCGGEEFDGGCLDKMAAGQCSIQYAECAGSCMPACQDKECGPDGCGGSCGGCPTGSVCLADGTCNDVCEPDCDGKECGPDGCGGKCGGCDVGYHCLPTGQCEPDCVPSCDGRECGDDGCGGTCGTCADGESCSGEGLCVLFVEVMPEPLPEVVEMGKDVQATDAPDVASPEATVEGADNGLETTVSSSTSCAGCATNRPEAGGAPLLLLLLAGMAWGAMRRTKERD